MKIPIWDGWAAGASRFRTARTQLEGWRVDFVGVSAKEIVVSTLAVLYAEDATAEEASLARTLRASGDFTPQSALAFLVFVLLYFPCIATVVAVRNEAGGGWALASMVYSTAVAWFVAWLVYHVALLL